MAAYIILKSPSNGAPAKTRWRRIIGSVTRQLAAPRWRRPQAEARITGARVASAEALRACYDMLHWHVSCGGIVALKMQQQWRWPAVHRSCLCFLMKRFRR